LTREEIYWSNHKIIDDILHKQCSKCKEWKPEAEEYFYICSKKNPDKGFQGECIVCSRERALTRKRNNLEKVKAVNRNWYYNNKERINKTARRWREENPERKQQYQLEYQKNNPEKMAQYSERRRQHKKHEITKSEWENCKNYFNFTCAYCGLPLSEHYYTRKGITKLGDFHKEHVNHNGGNDLTNCIPSCGSCNDQKWKFEFEEWYNKNNLNFTQKRYDRIIQWLIEDCFDYIEEKKPKGKYTKNPNNPKWSKVEIKVTKK
jgi:hypothetical protein